ncbi:LemA family protein [Cohaesibacter gelatinilyticus]|uniref:LemA protein n=1 Tax=Cohaesibacter gelatinilyticus TaxID=372072 RepID=A0A285PHB6_9HYPH|nr:LemA family protein [Cohaesibacter gelatinilyticus]SNZ21119.1 LemA protein [Cohaesibacter gelatinilyticus]
MFALIVVLLMASGLLTFIYIISFNGLATGHTKVEEGWYGIQVQLKRRHDLVPGLVKAVKSAMSHEETLVDRVLEAREKAIAALAGEDRDAIGEAEVALSSGLQGIFGYTEAYPDIKATGNIETLQKQLEETEDQIAASRRIFNSNVQAYNARLLSFPGNMIGPRHGFERSKSFELPEADLAAMQTAPSIDL